jgi:putative heme-binding domain-containing protein
VACHRFESDAGSEVGPNLKTIGAKYDRKTLLESLVAPSAKFADGFPGMISLTKKDGTALTATLLRQTPAEVALRLADGSSVTVPRAEISTMSEPVSVMPPMGLVLTKRQTRDIVAYLATLRGDKKSGKR